MTAPAGNTIGVGVWDDLVGAAVLGTERRPFGTPALAGGLGPVVSRAGASAGLAGVAAAVWAYRQAGLTPDGGPDREQPGREPDSGAGREPAAPADRRPLLPAGPVRTLAAILGEARFRAVLPEWLRLAARDGRRLPAEWLPDLLDTCGPAERPLLEMTGGPRAGWLAAHRPEWSTPAGRSGPGLRLAARLAAGDGTAWDAEASDEARLVAFAAVRAADPGRARGLAERVWAGEPGTTRAAMVASFGAGLSVDDETFLEGRLDDRRRDVRAEAARLLARLPASRLASRMAARAVPLVRVTGGAPPALEIMLPPEPDPSGRRDGLGRPGPRPARSGPGPAVDPAADLARMVAATPLPAWEAHLGRSPAELAGLAAATPTGPARALVAGWSAAAAVTGNRVWAEALLDAGAPPTAGLLEHVPAARAERALLDWLARTRLRDSLGLLATLPTPWSPAVSRAVVDRLGALVAGGDTAGAGPVRDALATVALAVHPDQAPATAALAAAAERLPAGPRGAARLFWARQLAQLAVTVHFRQAMYQEFR